jgi:hypothetical protein
MRDESAMLATIGPRRAAMKGQRGRKSAASLSIVPVTGIQRPEPPPEFTRRALWVHNGVATTQQLLEWCYPRDPAGRDRRQRKNRARRVCLTVRQMAVRIGRVWPGGNVWKMNADLMARWR